MAPKKNKTRKSGRVRRSTAGKILPPLDVRSNKQLKEFERRIKQGSITIVLVWAPWCGHCKNAKPEFEKVMRMAKGKAHMIDCDAHQDIAQKYDIKGFPTIRYYPKGPKNGNPREYQGNRTAEDMMAFMQ